jgi:hypothetical protein
MKVTKFNSWALGAIMVVCMGSLLASVAMAQAQTTTHPADQHNRMTNQDTNSNRMENVNDHHAIKASELNGLTVRTTGDEEKGKVKDLMIGPDGRVEYAAVSFGGFMGLGDKLFAVPFEAIHVVRNNNKVEFARIDVTEETIKDRKGFDQDHWPAQADQSFIAAGQRHAELQGVNVPESR